MAEAMAWRGLFRGYGPVRVKDLRRAASGEEPPKEQDRRARAPTAEPALSIIETLEHAAAGNWLWETAARIEAEIEAHKPRRRPGRRRAYPITALLLVDIALMATNWSVRAVMRELRDPVNARRLSRAARVAWPGRPDRRLPPGFITRSQYLRGLPKYLKHRVEDIQADTETASAGAASKAGMLQVGPLTRPETSSVIAGDGTWTRARTNAAPGDTAVDPVTGEIRPRRCDPDAVAYNPRHQDAARGLMCVFGSTRNEHPGERIVLFAEIGPRRSDANVFTDKYLQARAACPQIARGATAVVYDRALQPPAIDRLQNAGTIAVCKPQRNPDGGPAARNLGPHHLKLADGTETSVEVVAVDGTPTIIRADHEGEPWHIPLKRTKTQTRRNKHRPDALTTLWRVPTRADNPDTAALAGPLTGATLTIRHNPHNEPSHSRALRIIPPSDDDYDRLYGLREDVESLNNHYKSRLPNRRAHTYGRWRQQLNLIGYQNWWIITTLANWRRRTGGDLTDWFGQLPAP